MLGDPRWAGIYGVDADYVADENCKICVFLTDDMRVCFTKIVSTPVFCLFLKFYLPCL